MSVPAATVAPGPARRGRAGALGKRLANGLALVLVAPVYALWRLGAGLLPARADGIFQGYSQLMSLAPGMIGDYLRRAFYRLALRSCGEDATVRFGTVFATPEVDIGRGVYVGAFCNLGHVSLGDDVLLGSNVTILSGRRQHHFERLDVPIRFQGGTYTRVRVGRDVWIGNGAIVSADVGDQAVVAAGAVCVKEVQPRAIVGGNPARVLGFRGGAPADRAGAPGQSAPELGDAETTPAVTGSPS